MYFDSKCIGEDQPWLFSLVVLKIIILTNKTLHHTKFVQDILEVCPDIDVILETKSLIPPFDINHSYLELQDDYESNLWFQGTLPKIKNFVHSIEVNNINDQDCFIS